MSIIKQAEIVNNLTSKQEQFCQNIIAGMSLVDSYRNSYNTKMNDNALRVESSRLLDNPKIQKRLQELHKPIEEKFIAEQIDVKQKQIDFIQERIQHCKEKDDEGSIIRYMDMLNKLYSLYKEDVGTEKKDNLLNNLDVDTLKKLSAVS